MTAFLNAIAGRGRLIGQTPTASPSSMADVTVEAYRAAEAVDVPMAKSRAYGSQMELRETELQNALGEQEYNALKDEYRGRDYEYNKRVDELIEENRSAGVNGFYRTKTTKEISEEEKAKALTQLQRYNEVSQSATPSGRFVGSFAGAAGAFVTDPVNIAVTVATAIPFAPKIGGAGVARGLLGLSLREAAANAAAETAIQPMIADWYDDLGLDYGFSEFATNVGMAAALGGAIPPALYASKRGASFLFQQMESRLPPKMNAHAQMMQRVAHIEENNIMPASRPDASVAHAAHITKAEQAFEARQPLPDAVNAVVDVSPDVPFTSASLPMEAIPDLPNAKRVVGLAESEIGYINKAVQDVEIAAGVARVTSDNIDDFAGKADLPDWFKAANKAEAKDAKKAGRAPQPMTSRKLKNLAQKVMQGKPLTPREQKFADAMFKQADAIRVKESNARMDVADDASTVKAVDDYANVIREERKPLEVTEPTPEMDAALDADVARAAKTDADADIFLDDGSIMRMADIIEAQKADLSFIQQIRTCAL